MAAIQKIPEAAHHCRLSCLCYLTDVSSGSTGSFAHAVSFADHVGFLAAFGAFLSLTHLTASTGMIVIQRMLRCHEAGHWCIAMVHNLVQAHPCELYGHA